MGATSMPRQACPSPGLESSGAALQSDPPLTTTPPEGNYSEMTSLERTWITPEAHVKLRSELADLRSRPVAELSDDNWAANNAARKARIHEIHDLLTHAVVGEDPPDDGIAEPGMVLTIRYDDTGEIETFLLGARGAGDADVEVYSMHSPLGTAIAGAHPGQQRTYAAPSGTTVPVTLLTAVPYGLHDRTTAGNPG